MNVLHSCRRTLNDPCTGVGRSWWQLGISNTVESHTVECVGTPDDSINEWSRGVHRSREPLLERPPILGYKDIETHDPRPIVVVTCPSDLHARKTGGTYQRDSTFWSTDIKRIEDWRRLDRLVLVKDDRCLGINYVAGSNRFLRLD